MFIVQSAGNHKYNQIQVQIQNGCILGLCDRQVPGNRNSNKSNTEELTFLIIYEIEEKIESLNICLKFWEFVIGEKRLGSGVFR